MVLLGKLTGVMEKELGLSSGRLGVEWIGYLGGVGDVRESFVLSSCRYWVGEEKLFVVSCLTVRLRRLPSDDGEGVVAKDDGVGVGDMLRSRALNILWVWIREWVREEE